MEAFDFAGRTKLPRGPHVAHGPQVGKPCSISYFHVTELFENH